MEDFILKRGDAASIIKMLDSIFTAEIFAYCVLVFFPSFIAATFYDGWLLHRIRDELPGVYEEVKGNVDDSYLVKGARIGLIHGFRLNYVIFRCKYLNDIGKWKTAIYILIALGWKVTLLYMVASIVLYMSSVISW